MNRDEEKIKIAIQIYKEKCWTNLECEECGTTNNVKIDNETFNNYCESCLEDELRQDIKGLFDTVGKEAEFILSKGTPSTIGGDNE